MWAFLIVAVVFSFVFAIVKVALEHAENIARIKYGNPPIDADGTRELPSAEMDYRRQ